MLDPRQGCQALHVESHLRATIDNFECKKAGACRERIQFLVEWQMRFFGVDDECEYRELIKLRSGDEPLDDVSGTRLLPFIADRRMR